MQPSQPEPARRRRLRAGGHLGQVAVDVAPLRVSRDFRRIWLGLLISETGYQLTLVAIYVQVFRLTGSAAAVGLTGLFSVAALIIGVLVSGAFIDRFDRRTVLLGAQLGFAVGSLLLLVGAIAGRPPVGLVYGGAALTAGVSTIDSPTRTAMTPRLVGHDLLPAAMALNQVVWNLVGLIGPAIGGVIIARYGVAWAYGLDLITYGVMFAMVLGVRPMRPEAAEHTTSGLEAVREGFSFLRGRRVIRSTFVIDLIAMIFGMPRALFPILAATQFRRGPATVGLLFAAPALGALVAALTSGWAGNVRRQGLAVIWAVIGWGAAIAAFGLVGSRLPAALLLLAVAGAADVISAIFRNTILQASVPDRLRGRLSGIHILVVTGGPRLGDLEAGVVAQWFSPLVSVVSGGLLCVAGAALVGVIDPELRRYRSTTVADPTD